MTPPMPSSIHEARSVHVDAQSNSEQTSTEQPELWIQVERVVGEERLFVGGEKEARTVLFQISANAASAEPARIRLGRFTPETTTRY